MPMTTPPFIVVPLAACYHRASYARPVMRNWAGNHTYRAARVVRPRNLDELRGVVAGATELRVLGSRHSFNDIADTAGDLVSLEQMPRVVEIDSAARLVRIDGAVRYGELCARLDSSGFALDNLASLPHITVAGSVATATHGTGYARAALSSAVRSIDFVRADGEIDTLERGRSAEFDGSVVSVGALGVVVGLTLDIEPTYAARQVVYEHLPAAAFTAHFDDLVRTTDHVSFFTNWRTADFDQVWLKQRMDAGTTDLPRDLLGAPRANLALHPIRELSAEACTQQLGVPGPWHERIPHFRADHTPSSGDELQSEYFVGYPDAVAAYEALWKLAVDIAPLIQITEIRAIAEDALWLSPCYERASAAFHFTWRSDWDGVRALLPRIEEALAPFAARAHWAKLFAMDSAQILGRYPRAPDFVALARSRDPRGKFANDYLRRVLFGDPHKRMAGEEGFEPSIP
ncbi:MAG TPA: FAD-binding protein [Candidatus Limnocylindria bacterium]|nr:FAD-binding protein [Candidatus Limnocylindria bacterium]